MSDFSLIQLLLLTMVILTLLNGIVFFKKLIKLQQETNELLSKILSKNENIFNWISIFDFNIIIIVSVMIVVAIVNIIIALMVLIFERNKMIGILKSMRANNNLIRKIFLYKGAEIIIKGLLFGNIIFFIIVFIQKKFNIIKLNSEDYYVDTLPFYLDSFYIIGLNALFICVSIFVLWFTFSIISKISPSKIINTK